MDVALLAEASGLCSILRGPEHDGIYAHPADILTLCGRITHPAADLVSALCDLLLKLPGEPGTDASGKLYEETIMMAYVCRAATCTVYPIDTIQFLGLPQATAADVNEPLIFSPPAPGRRPAPQIPAPQTIACFPRASASIATLRKNHSNDLDGVIRCGQGTMWDTMTPSARGNKECSSMPAASATPTWFSHLSHPYNLVFDALLRLPYSRTASAKSGVCIAIQGKEMASPDKADVAMKENRNHRRGHMEWKACTAVVVKEFLDENDLVTYFFHRLQ